MWLRPGHVTVAEPNAMVGFLGPKVCTALNGSLSPLACSAPRTSAITGWSIMWPTRVLSGSGSDASSASPLTDVDE